jgi:hypothetical protein
VFKYSLISSTGIDVLRIRGPSSEDGTGRVEVFYAGQWGTVCDESWDIEDAQVVCRQFGYKYAIRAIRSGRASVGVGPIWLSGVGCSGSEEILMACPYRGWGIKDCRHSQDAGVECSNAGKLDSFFYI